MSSQSSSETTEAHRDALRHEIGQLRATLRYLIDYGMGEDEHPYRVARKALGDE
jgi:hypothetical protein